MMKISASEVARCELERSRLLSFQRVEEDLPLDIEFCKTILEDGGGGSLQLDVAGGRPLGDRLGVLVKELSVLLRTTTILLLSTQLARTLYHEAESGGRKGAV